MISFRAVPRRTIHWYPGLWRDVAETFTPGADPEALRVELESRFAAYIGRRHGVAVSSCRMALVLLLQAQGLVPGDEVILPAYTEEGVPMALIDAGFRPVFVDILPGDHNLDPERVAAAVGERTRAVLATHLFGAPCDVKALAEICERRRLILLEDCAHAVGIAHQGRMLGAFGHASIFSYATTKPFQAFGGGMLCTDDERLARRVREAVAAASSRATRAILKDVVVSYHVHLLTRRPLFGLTLYPTLRLMGLVRSDLIAAWRAVMRSPQSSYGPNLAMHAVQLRVALGMLARNDAENAARRANAAALYAGLSQPARALLLDDHPDHGRYFSVLVSPRRDQLAADLLRAGVDTGKKIMRHCPAVLGFEGQWPVTEQAWTQSLQIPVHSSLGATEVAFIADGVNRAVARK